MYLVIVFLFVFMTVVAISVVGVLIYMIYFPFKKWLINSGKLSMQQSRRINFAYILLFIFIAIYFGYIVFESMLDMATQNPD